MIDMTGYGSPVTPALIGLILLIAGGVLLIAGVVLLVVRLTHRAGDGSRHWRGRRRKRLLLPVLFVLMGLAMGVGGVGVQGWRVSLDVKPSTFTATVERELGVKRLECRVTDGGKTKPVNLDVTGWPGYEQVDCSYVAPDGSRNTDALMVIDREGKAVALYDDSGRPLGYEANSIDDTKRKDD